mgnify:CR=1 FL=1
MATEDSEPDIPAAKNAVGADSSSSLRRQLDEDIRLAKYVNILDGDASLVGDLSC